MVDKIALRKIKYDVLDMLELTDLVDKIEKFIKEKDNYKDNLDYAKELIRTANLDISLNTMDEIVEALNDFIESLNDIQNFRHYPMLDYINDLNLQLLSENQKTTENIFKEKLKMFIMLMEQIHLLQSKLLEAFLETISVDDKGNIRDIESDEIMFDARLYRNGRESDDDEQIFKWALEYLVDFLIKSQKDMITKLDFDDDGYFISMSGEDLFSNDEKQALEEKVKDWFEMLYPEPTDEDLDEEFKKNKVETKEKDSELDNKSVDLEIEDDVSVTKSEMTKESKERMSRLKETLKASTNKMRK